MKGGFKKGFFFSMDAFLALMLFVLIVALIYSFFINMGTLRQQYYFSEDLFNVMNGVEIGELDESYYTIIGSLDDLDQNMTIMEQIATYRINNSLTAQTNFELLMQDIITDLRGQYGTSVDIEDWTYGLGESGTNIVVRQRIVSGEERIE